MILKVGRFNQNVRFCEKFKVHGKERVAAQQNRKVWGVAVVPTGLFLFFFIISCITVVGVQLKATNSEVLILASKEDKDK